MPEQDEAALYHPAEDVEFEYGVGQPFALPNVDDEYWYVMDRVWNYDADLEDSALPPEMFHKQYQLAEVSSLGGNARLVTEAVLDREYEPVDKETARQVI